MTIKLTRKQKEVLEAERQEHPSEVAFFELLNACGGYDE